MKKLECISWEINHHWRFNPSIKFAVTHFYTWMERGSARMMSCPRSQHSVPGRSQMQTTWSRVKRTDHKLTEPPPSHYMYSTFLQEFLGSDDITRLNFDHKYGNNQLIYSHVHVHRASELLVHKLCCQYWFLKSNIRQIHCIPNTSLLFVILGCRQQSCDISG